MPKAPRPASHKLFGSFLAARRKRAGLVQPELADEVPVKRETLSQWERGILEYLPEPNVINKIAAKTETPAWQFIAKFGYELGFEGIQGEEEPEILDAYRQLEPHEKQLLRGVLGLEGELTMVEFLESLHRLAAMGLPGRRGTLE